MDKKSHPAELIDGGAEFLTALQKLGLDPEGCFWAIDKEFDERFVLILMTSAFDLVGPLAISEKIVAAYNASALPSVISPFMVRVHSPNHTFMQFLLTLDFRTSLRGLATKPHRIAFEGTPYETQIDWLYKFEEPKKARSPDILRRWRRFTSNVDALAA